MFKNNKDGVVGKFRYENDRGKRKNPKIYINKCIHWNDEDLIDVMIHEMIHYYVIFIMGYDGFFSHGFKFRKKRKEIRNKGQIVHIRYSHLKYNSEV